MGSGIYIDQIDAYINLQRDQTWKEIQGSIIKIILTLVGLILVSVLISTRMIRKTQSHFDKFIGFFNRAASALEPLNEKEMQWAEFETLALSANQMLSAREDTRKSLVKSEAKYRRLFERANDAIFVVDKKNGRYMDANDAALKLVERSLDDLKQLTTRDVTPRGAQRRIEMLESSNNSLKMGEVIYVRPDGSERIAELSVVPLTEETIYVIARDITDRKKTDESLKDSEERFRILVEKSPLGISLIDGDGRYIYRNHLV